MHEILDSHRTPTTSNYTGFHSDRLSVLNDSGVRSKSANSTRGMCTEDSKTISALIAADGVVRHDSI